MGHFQNSRILEFQNSRIPESGIRNSGIPGFWNSDVYVYAYAYAYAYVYVYLEFPRWKNGYHLCFQIGHFQNSRIPEFQNPESEILGSRDSGNPEMANLKAETRIPLMP